MYDDRDDESDCDDEYQEDDFICRVEYLAGKSYPGEKLLDGVQ